MPSIEYDIEIRVRLKGTGSWGNDCTLAQVRKQAEDELRNLKVEVKRGANLLEQKTRPQMEITRLHLDPNDD